MVFPAPDGPTTAVWPRRAMARETPFKAVPASGPYRATTSWNVRTGEAGARSGAGAASSGAGTTAGRRSSGRSWISLMRAAATRPDWSSETVWVNWVTGCTIQNA